MTALIAAKDAEGSIGATVRAVGRLRGVTRVVVIDDGSSDATGDVAHAAGAHVVALPENQGKGGALAAGVAAAPDAETYLLADADLGDTATGLQSLLDAYAEGAAQLVVGVLPSAGGRGGFGLVKQYAAAGIRRACGLDLTAPLSGQRVIDGPLLRSLTLAPRFGVEVAMTIDAARSGASVAEIPVDVDHHHTGRSLAGFRHRGRQGADISAALLARLTSRRLRFVAIGAGAVSVLVALTLISVVTAAPRGEALPRSDRVVLFAFDRLGLEDLDRAELPGVRGLVRDGAAGALSVRTTDRRSLARRAGPERPSALDAAASLGASERVRAAPSLGPLTDRGIDAAVMAQARQQARADRLGSLPGALGDALRAEGKRTAYVGGAQLVASGRAGFPAAAAVADRSGRIDVVDTSAGLLQSSSISPVGVRASVEGFILATARAMRDADVVLVDPGETARFADARAPRVDALRRTDEILLGVRGLLPRGATLVVYSPTPPGDEWELTPAVIYRVGGRASTLASSSTRRAGLGTLTDLAPTVLASLGIDAPDAMTGSALRASSGRFAPDGLQALTADGAVRARFFLGASVAYTVAAIVLYLVVGAAVVAGMTAAWRRWLRVGICSAMAFPLALLLTGAIQHWGGGGESPVLLVAVGTALGAALSSLRRLAPVIVTAVGVVGLVALDVAATGPLHTASLLGYSLQTTGRFYGLPNASFAVFAGSLLLLAGAVAGGARASTPSRAAAATAILGVGVAFVGAPWLGNDVGGTLALLPVAAALAWSFAGGAFTRRTLAFGLSAVASGIALLIAAETLLGSGTHLGRAFGGGPSSLGTTLARRAANNWGLLVDQWWGFLLFVLVGAVLVALWQGHARDELPAGSSIRAAFTAVLALSIAAFVLNDSGPVVAVLCVVVAAPVLALRAIDASLRRQSGR